MSNSTRESFRQFNNLDPQARLEQFQKRFDRLKSEFQNSPSRQMFDSPERQMFFNNHHPSWATGGPTDANAHPANGHVPLEKTIPIQVQHERSRSEPVDNNQTSQTGSVPHDRMHFMPDDSFFQHKFAHPFGPQEATAAAGDNSGEPRVHHIPIQVETRNANRMGQNFAASQNVPNQTNLNHHQQYHQQPAPAAATSTSSSDNRPTRVIEVPIQISKSSSTPETSKKVENNLQGAANASSANVTSNNINESASDPAIADPTKVYAMGYEPLPSNKAASNEQKAPVQKKQTPFDFVDEVLADLKNYESQVHEFNGSNSSDKGYRYLDEMLTLCVLRLDCINIDGDDKLRMYRKKAINEVNRVAAILETKVSKPTQQSESQGQQSSTVDQKEPVAEPANVANSQPAAEPVAEPKDKKEKKQEAKAKAKKEKEEKEKNKKESGEKKEGRRIILFRGKNKNKAPPAASNQNAEAGSSAETTSSASTMDVDPNNNDLKDAANQSTSSDQNSETASTSSSTLQGKETAV